MAEIPPSHVDFFKSECGVHVWQDYDRGRVQTCTFTISVLEEHKSTFDLSKVNKKYTRGSGNGGQNRNKVETCVVLTDPDSGVSVRYQGQRKRGQNEKIAYQIMSERLGQISQKDSSLVQNTKRLEQINRDNGRKRTYKIKDGIVIDHVTNKRIPVSLFYKGRFDLLS